MLKLKKISKIYKTATLEVKALDEVSLCFRKNEFVSILGPSGCGKTTTLNIIGGLDKYTTGDLLINNVSTKDYHDREWDVYRNHRIGFIFQAYNLIPHQNILENVELALTIAGMGKAERTAKAKAALDRVGLKGMYTKKPNELSGGQCQRVAIARALVNEPDIILADEPTGALDSETSVMIMKLIKEVSKDKLVIMVTHNNELAKEYSTRIISLLDGRVVGDTNPYTEEEEAKEYEKGLPAFDEAKEKAKMSWWTAFKLSTKNLITKFKRTFMTVVASSIGIVGVSAVLAVSYGVRGYLASIQDDMLSGNPVQITQNSVDYLKLLQSASNLTQSKIISESWKDGKIDIQFAMESLVKTATGVSESLQENDIDENYIQYLKDMPSSYYNAMTMDYGLNIKNNLFTNTQTGLIYEGINYKTAQYSISGITNICTTILENCRDGEFKSFGSMVDGYTNAFGQCIDNEEYVLSQYNVVAGTYPHEANELMVVLNHQNEVTEFVLTLLGYYGQDEFANAIYYFSNEGKEGTYDKELWAKQQSIDVSKLVGKEYTYYPNDSIFRKNPSYNDPDANPLDKTVYQPFFYDYLDNGNLQNGMKMKVTGVLTPKENVRYGCLSSGLFYTPKFAQKFIEDNYDSELTTFLRDTLNASDKGASEYTSTLVNLSGLGEIISGIGYDMNVDFEGKRCTSTFLVGSTNNMSSLFSMLSSASGSGQGGEEGQGGGTGSSESFKILKTASISPRQAGGEKLPSRIEIYPLDFDNKFLVTDYLSAWNGDKPITLSNSQTPLAAADRGEVNYTDNLELIIGMINGMVDIVTIALVCFTALSLVVSTVMIGIITYVSVMERVKEIGVIRSLGGRKKDVSHLFNAETFIIGMGGGLFGLAVTYLLEFILNVTVGVTYNLGMIANLPWTAALVVLLCSIGLTTIAGLTPARSAARQDPVKALRSE
ncbi:MAG: ABC transporter ATP-binding protein/permease [Bacilli bacterium]|nr:ABC transporter ATP-binding protein/permease [Bacilli bacterium]